ncbi:unnamed protein product [Mytilus coruscus]|uniref:Uncharacterized protein n=1 Tax=Mytilus coruscus TaxID=42192 RepID=A0A6J8AEC2_MYTCO|nr:unnamed protein product [Mytilus coruscus]
MIQVFVVPSSNLTKSTLNYKKKKRKDFKQSILDQLDNLQSNNQKEYWSLVNYLREEQKEKPENSIEADTWLKYFSNLSSIPSNISDKVKKIEEKLNLLETKTEYSSTLNNDITSSELQKAFSKLKSGKSPDLNSITFQQNWFSIDQEILCGYACFLSENFKSSESVRNYVSGVKTLEILLNFEIEEFSSSTMK